MDSLTSHSEHSGSGIIDIEGLKYLRGEVVATRLSSSPISRKDSSPVPVTVVSSNYLTWSIIK